MDFEEAMEARSDPVFNDTVTKPSKDSKELEKTKKSLV
jgi:hypothetical protein